MRSENRLASLALWSAALLLGVAFCASVASLRASASVRAGVGQSRIALQHIDTLREALLDAETGQRGYLLTGQTDYLTPYHRGVTAVPVELAALRSLVHGDPVERRLLDQLAPVAASKLGELQRTIDLHDSSAFRKSLDVVISNQGKRDMDRARDLLGTLQAHQDGVLDERRTTADAWTTGAAAAGIAASGLLFVLVGGGTIAIQRGVRQRGRLMEELRVGEQRLRVTLQSIGDGLLATDEHGRVTLMNGVAERLTGWTLAEALGKSHREVFCIVHEPTHDVVESPIVEAQRDNRIVHLANHSALVSRDGTTRPIEDSASPIRSAGGAVSGVILIFRDVSAQHRARTDLEAANERLRRAMAETHHRVKNNLQAIASLLDLQRSDEPAGVVGQALGRVEQHVTALAAIHDLLTEEAHSGREGDRLRVPALLGRLQPLLDALAGGRRVRLSVADVELSARQGASLTLLVNELVANAIKHGEGDIEVSLASAGDDVELAVRDHGAGFPAGFDADTAANTGLDLVRSFGQWDLKGSVRFANDPQGGGVVSVRFPLTATLETARAARPSTVEA